MIDSVDLLPSLPADPFPLPAVPAPASRQAMSAELADLLRAAVGKDDIAPDAHFFTDLGADSLVMAKFCARVRKREDLPTVSMKDVYRNPTLNALADLMYAKTDGEAAAPSPIELSVPKSRPITVAHPGEYVLCGFLQAVVYLGYATLIGVVMAPLYLWVAEVSDPVSIYLRSLAAGSAVLLVSSVLPIILKWLIVGRWHPREIRIWSLGYFRFWLVKTITRTNPMALTAGSPLFSLYLRALGAKIGPNVTILTRNVPVCTDLLTIGEGTVIRKDAFLNGYRAHAGMIQIGPVTLGRDVLISEMTVIDINTAMGHGTQLGHRSTLVAGQSIPDGEHWHGSPAQRTDVDFAAIPTLPSSRWRRIGYPVGQLLPTVLLWLPLGFGLVDVLLSIPRIRTLMDALPHAYTNGSFYVDALLLSALLVFGGLIVGLVFVMTVPRLLNRFLVEDRVYPLYGLRYSLHRAITRFTNSQFLTNLFGDSSYIVYYLRTLGYRMKKIEQTGSNFGCLVKHENPYLVDIGSGTMVADGLSIANADYTNTSFRVTRATIGSHSFLGNDILYPPGSRVGDNCLLATKVNVPIDGPIREGVGLLGSPSFEIPRSVERDASFDELKTNQQIGPHLAAKNRYNRRTMGLLLLVRWGAVAISVMLGMLGLEFSDTLGALAIGFALFLTLVVEMIYAVLVERATSRFGGMSPRFCSIYHPYFWWHERFWKLVAPARILNLFNGTPFKAVIWRLLGVRMGTMVFDDGASFIERLLTSVGSYCTLNAGAIVQCHSQEDGTFKSDRTTLEDGVTLGVGALVHYGVTVGEGAVVATDSFLMKGETVAPYALFGGNPAREICQGITTPPVSEVDHTEVDRMATAALTAAPYVKETTA